MPKTEETSTRGAWMRLSELCAGAGLDESEIKRALERGEIERLHRAGEVLYRMRSRNSDLIEPHDQDRDQNWRDALAAFKARQKGRFLSRKRQKASSCAGPGMTPEEADEPSSRDPELKPWARFPGWFAPDFHSEETVV